ncbi:nuclear protein UL24 [Saimiriine betaherpesvirus 4]|uniref:Nuclear protein UL24 n=1 Tax=Saimiriine betaherpesvirus 4 TaxID=1535247 RepID=G8XSY1_9BETA|nr:nuclear protein UL24 [Saimiriine betaherpesvirus 4]AEV80927.1 nuclear protein UL24 [Saimiriine betaherpesvirus 4]
MSSSGQKCRSLCDLPKYRAVVGKRKHFLLYRQIVRSLKSFQRFNCTLGGVFPPELATCRRSVFFEVTLLRRIPDCIVLFNIGKLDRKIVCYVFEFKTTQSSADAVSVRKHCTHYLQYVQGLRQLKDTVEDLKEFAIGGVEGDIWEVIPVIAFYQQNEMSPSFCRTFRVTTLRFRSESVVRALCRGQDESLRNVLSLTRAEDRARSRASSRARVRRRRLRAARGQRAVGTRARAAASAGRHRNRVKTKTG